MILEDKEKSQFIAFTLSIIAGVAIAFALYFTRPIMIPFVLALFVRLLIDPIIDFQIRNLRIHRAIAIFVSIFLIIGLFVIIIPFITDSVATFLRSADDYNTKVLLLIDNIISKMQEFEIEINREIIRESFLSLPFLDWASSALSNGANFVGKFFLVVIMTLFLLVGSSKQKKSDTWNEINAHVKKYIFTKFITSALTGILTGIIYWLLGLELALIFGTLTFLLNFIPTFGSIVAVLLPLPVAFLQYDETVMIVLVLILPSIVHMTIGNIIEPKLFGKAFGLHPVTIILALIFWGILWGITGMLLAAPLTAIIKIAFEQFSTTKPIARILAGNIHHKI